MTELASTIEPAPSIGAGLVRAIKSFALLKESGVGHRALLRQTGCVG